MNNMNGFQNFNGFGYPNAGVMPNSAVQGVNVKSWLSPEMINQLKKQQEQFSFSVNQEEIERAICNHRDVNGNFTGMINEDGTCTCAICGYTFAVTEEYTPEEVTHATSIVESILQTCKMMYISLDPAVGRDFFQVIAFIRKIPQLYKVASEDYKKYENVYGFTQGVPQNAFAIFGSMTNPGFGGFAQYTGQQYPGAYQQPMMAGYQPPTGYAPQQMNPQAQGNPFFQQGYQPQQNYGQPAPFQTQQTYQQGAVNGYAGYTQPPITGQGFAMNPQGAAAQAPTSTPAQNNPTPAPADTKAAVNDQFKG